MLLNVSYPATGCQKLFKVEDEKKLRIFYERRMGQEVDVDSLGDEWKGYVVKIAGGNDKQGFPMKQGVLTNNRVRLLLSKGHSCYRPRRDGERKRKSVRGCIVDSNLSVLALVIVKKGDNELTGLTDKVVPRRLGPKRASKIRKLFNLSKKDDVRQYVIKHPVKTKEGKPPKMKAPKIQRLITPVVLQRKRHKLALKRLRRQKNREEKADYAKLLALRQKEAMRRTLERRRRRSSLRDSKSSKASGEASLAKVLGPPKSIKSLAAANVKRLKAGKSLGSLKPGKAGALLKGVKGVMRSGRIGKAKVPSKEKKPVATTEIKKPVVDKTGKPSAATKISKLTAGKAISSAKPSKYAALKTGLKGKEAAKPVSAKAVVKPKAPTGKAAPTAKPKVVGKTLAAAKPVASKTAKLSKPKAQPSKASGTASKPVKPTSQAKKTGAKPKPKPAK